MKTFALCVTLLGICCTVSATTIGAKLPITDQNVLKELTEKVSSYMVTMSKQQLELIRIRSATKQIVAGVVYEMDAEVNEKNTPTDCKVSLGLKPWMNFVRLYVQCGPREYIFEKIESQQFDSIVGGYRPMSREALQELKPKLLAVFDNLKASKQDFVYTLKSMLSGKQQLVNGMNYKLKVVTTNDAEQAELCDVKIFATFKGEFKEVDITCGKKSFHYPSVAVMSVPGGKTPITDQKTLTNLNKKVNFYLGKINGENEGVELKLLRTIAATQQVVAGVLYDLTAELNENGQTVSCKIDLWEQPWTNFARMNVECGKEKRKYTYESQSFSKMSDNIVGGYRKMTEQGLKTLEPKLSAVFDLLKDERDDFVYTLKRMVSGKQQVVAGMHYIVQVEVTNNADEVKQCEADIFQNLRSEIQQADIKCAGKVFHYTQY